MQSINIKSYQLKVTLFGSALFTIMLILLISLGFWQLDRAKQKLQIKAEIQAHSHSKSLSLSDIDKRWLQSKSDKKLRKALEYYPLLVNGEYEVNHLIYLDNKIQNHLVGYRVLAPLYTAGGRIILVDRGWLPATTDRSVLPKMKVESGQQTVIGHIVFPPSRVFALSQAIEKGDWPLVIEYIDLKQIAERLKSPVYRFILKLGQIKTKVNVQRHYGYAVQWFALALTWIILFMVLAVKREKE